MHNQTLMGWLVGLGGVSLILGSIVTPLVRHYLRQYFDSLVLKKKWTIPEQATESVILQPFLTGLIERLFFTVLVAFNVSGVAGGIITWIIVKMVSGWNRYTGGDETWRRVLAFNALINSLISLLFAVIGGLIVNGNIPLK